ncbi:type III secretion system HrpP C-terminal domain-containing protein [Kosakonia sp. MUSA4]|uniref:type III secretion system HrpP C-terminal domain-containing protein n=1 Tax=Kosakonia sp. MUSA4 TaxID=2067958 RepID=UPI0015971931|nr:type III secretion system HrpP C-terminal domain-containing protein [Kosakonia sp. MUSA4]QJT82624.1 hypothetical protein C0557_22375 [Kosakonia sp. MUSA4]
MINKPSRRLADWHDAEQNSQPTSVSPLPAKNSPRQKLPAHPLSQRATVHHTTQTPMKTPSGVADNAPLGRDKEAFSQWLNAEDAPLALATLWLSGNPDALRQSAQEMAPPESAQATVLWQQIEPALSQNLAAQAAFPARFSLLLPLLGEVHAHVGLLSDGGMDIALGFSPSLYDRVRGSELSCREALARRTGKRIRLRFQHQDTLS